MMQTRRIGLSINSTIDPSLTQKSIERLTEWLPECLIEKSIEWLIQYAAELFIEWFTGIEVYVSSARGLTNAMLGLRKVCTRSI